MKTKARWILALLIFHLPVYVSGQKHEVTQLLLNVEKLAQFKDVLRQMKQGYEILSKGYGSVKDITQGNFSLHKAFLDGLLKVNPTVKKYYGISELISLQLQLLDQTKRSYLSFIRSDCFNSNELQYIARVHRRAMKESVETLEELTAILADGKFRMSDSERIEAIDALLEKQRERKLSINAFDSRNKLLVLQRMKEYNDVLWVERMNR